VIIMMRRKKRKPRDVMSNHTRQMKLTTSYRDGILREEEPEEFECGAPVDSPPTPNCCTLAYGKVCQLELVEEHGH
jgi:hypothetical protein